MNIHALFSEAAILNIRKSTFTLLGHTFKNFMDYEPADVDFNFPPQGRLFIKLEKKVFCQFTSVNILFFPHPTMVYLLKKLLNLKSVKLTVRKEFNFHFFPLPTCSF